MSGECKIYGADEDTWDHAMLHYTISRCIWALMDKDLTELVATLRIADPKHWVFYVFDNLSQF